MGNNIHQQEKTNKKNIQIRKNIYVRKYEIINVKIYKIDNL